MLQFVKGRKMENNEPIRDQEIEIDLVALFHELVKHWKALVASMVLLAAVFGLYSKITFVPEYEASAEMYVLTKSTSITSLADIQVGSSLTNDYEYGFGVILNYLFRVDKLMAIAEKSLPLHVVEKKVPYIDENGTEHKPETPNAYKFETLILDMVYMMDNSLPFEVDREKEFAPVKNATGTDSVETARALLDKNGIEI